MTEPASNPVFTEFAAKIHDKYEVVFRDCMNLARIGNELFSRPLTEPLHRVIRFIAKIVVNSNGAVLTLVVNGYGNDAMKLARSMFEGAVTIAYLRLHPELVADYLDYDSIRSWRVYEFMISNSPEYIGRIPQEIVDEMRAEYERVLPRVTHKKRVWDSWRKSTSLRVMATEVGLGQFYPTFYGTASGMHHLDSSGLRSQVSHDVLDVEVAPSERHVQTALAMSHNLTFRVLYDFNEEAGLGMGAALEGAKTAHASNKFSRR